MGLKLSIGRDRGIASIGHAVGGAKRMDRLIRDLLEYSRSGMTARSEPTPLADAVAAALINLTVDIRESEIGAGSTFFITFPREFPMAGTAVGSPELPE